MNTSLFSLSNHLRFKKPGDGGSGGGGDQQPPPGGDPGQNQTETPPADWNTFITGQPEDIQLMFNDHTSGLRSALSDERGSAKKFKQQVDDLSSRLEAGSDAQKRLEKLSGQLEAQGLQSEFYEDAQSAGVTNFKLAWLAYNSDSSEFTTRGHVDFDKLKGRHPELFRKTQQQAQTPPGNPGSGTGDPPPGGDDINTLIRKASGRSG